MNQLTSFQRKIAYLVGIVLLLPLIIYLGKPAGRSEGEITAGGRLAQLRQEYQLGETSLGNVDPSSSTMNLVLLGFRGVATNLLWQKALEERDQKQWASLRNTVQSIILLQPHYIKVWDFQGWNLAYNVSAEWDNVPDRWYWVKEGGKFFMQGTRRNDQNAMLTHKTGILLSQKVGRSDERDYFRRYFLDDPDDDRFGDEADLDFNRGYDQPGPFEDNYLAARDWFLEANRRETSYPQTSLGIQRELFRSYPAHSYFEMANALQREGKVGDRTQLAWSNGHNAWTKDFGMEEFPSVIGNYRLETSPEEYPEIARRNSEELGIEITPEDVRVMVQRRQDTTNYRYWRSRSAIESQSATVKAHQDIYQGQVLYREGKFNEASERIREGLAGLAKIFGNYPDFQRDELIVEEALMAMIYLRSINRLENGEEALPEDTPLHDELWVPVQDQSIIEDLERQFRRQTGLTGTR